MIPAFIPSPDQGTWQIGFFELRAYALCIIAGVLVAVWLGNKRWVARGGRPGTVADVAVWAVPFGLVGARLYHVATDWQLYFCSTCDPVQALYIWRGGLGIWGAVALGAVGAWIGCRRRGVSFPAFGDAIVPAIAVAQAIGRWGNWFNQELFGRPTTLPWGLQIDPAFRPDGFERFATFQPTFLYESLWDLGIAGFLVWADRRFRLGHGRVIALYIMAYTAGRGWIEMLRIDEANHIFGLRLNVWTSIIVFLFGLVLFVWSARRHPGRETPEELGGEPVTAPAAAASDAAVSDAATDQPEGAEVGPETSTETSSDPPPEEPEAEPSDAEAESEPADAEAEPEPADAEAEPEPADAEAEPEPADPEAEPEPADAEAEPEPADPEAESEDSGAEAESEPQEPPATTPAATTPASTAPAATTTKARKPRRRFLRRRR